jgi:hypothetical protein
VRKEKTREAKRCQTKMTDTSGREEEKKIRGGEEERRRGKEKKIMKCTEDE